jgi:hypothetical protein
MRTTLVWKDLNVNVHRARMSKLVERDIVLPLAASL